MEIKKIDTTTQKQTILATRPDSFDDFIWQSHIKQMLQTDHYDIYYFLDQADFEKPRWLISLLRSYE